MFSIIYNGFKKKILNNKKFILGRLKNNNINNEFLIFDNYGNILCKEPKTIIKNIDLNKMWKKNENKKK